MSHSTHQPTRTLATTPDLDPAPAVQRSVDLLQAKATHRSRAGQTADIQRALTQRAGGARSDQDTAAVHRAAAHGISDGGGALPHLDAIQRSFGPHDVSSVQAHVGGKAADASAAMGAQAYATGSDVAFAQSPDLHTAAHEAAHIVQQRAGVALKGGVGQAGDPYERHADAVADRVVQGQSAADLLDQMAGDGATDAVQHSLHHTMHQAANHPVQRQEAGQAGGDQATEGTETIGATSGQITNFANGANGMFDASLSGDWLTCTWKLQFNFLAWDESTPELEAQAHAEQAAWKSQFITIVESTWSAVHPLVPTAHPDARRVEVAVVITEVTQNPHFAVNVTKTSTARGSEVGRGGGGRGGRRATLDTLDHQPKTLTGDDGTRHQLVPTAHEFGHMIGNPDRYHTVRDEGIMSVGGTVQQQDYQPFADALDAIEGTPTWSVGSR